MTTTAVGRRDWFDQVESERLPANEEVEKDGKILRTEYRYDENTGNTIRTTKTYRIEKIRVLPIVAERKKWRKFGNAANDPPGINTGTTKVDDDITMQFISSKEDAQQEEEEMIKGAVAALRKVQCRYCKGEHWTTKCPFKDSLASIMDNPEVKSSDTVDRPPAPSNTQPSAAGGTASGGGETVGRWVSTSARRGGAGGGSERTDRGPDRMGGPSRGGGSYRSGDSSMRKQDEATVRVTNLPEETQEQDLRDLFQPFGHVSRVFLAKDKITAASKGFAFITFNEKKDAQKAIDCVSGFGYDHLILKVEWANKPNN
ncbi:unnamed protein product [Didymodactylos carnosus]|uniref:Eukaryotic translation initiation factor 3 subunit G n=1 Tax=Didymodactylos carnosus TaxID=1234261 RepID=A0A813ULZ2_9BILA|nr:unnamed protein product [Didymodactylos carnosus]CAF3614769.1 unnamed protein product [Didymodactylos carnosus]